MPLRRDSSAWWQNQGVKKTGCSPSDVVSLRGFYLVFALIDGGVSKPQWKEVKKWKQVWLFTLLEMISKISPLMSLFKDRFRLGQLGQYRWNHNPEQRTFWYPWCLVETDRPGQATIYMKNCWNNRFGNDYINGEGIAVDRPVQSLCLLKKILTKKGPCFLRKEIQWNDWLFLLWPW